MIYRAGRQVACPPCNRARLDVVLIRRPRTDYRSFDTDKKNDRRRWDCDGRC